MSPKIKEVKGKWPGTMPKGQIVRTPNEWRYNEKTRQLVGDHPRGFDSYSRGRLLHELLGILNYYEKKERENGSLES